MRLIVILRNIIGFITLGNFYYSIIVKLKNTSQNHCQTYLRVLLPMILESVSSFFFIYLKDKNFKC